MAPLGYYGAGVWGSNPVVDEERNSIYVGTGNNYLHPDSTAPSSIQGMTHGDCISGGGTAATCNAAGDHVDSIVALNLTTGAVKWARKLVDWNQGPYIANGSDDWNVDCIFGFPQCPSNAGPDYDFGSAPNPITYKDGHHSRTILGAGQKSGIYYALDPATGAVLWQTQVGPGSALGGMEWGSASDPNGAIDIGPVTVANGVVYAASMALAPTEKTMFALNAATGQIVWSFAAGSSVNAGATVVDGVVYWGSGYTNLGPPYTGNTKFYAFK